MSEFQDGQELVYSKPNFNEGETFQDVLREWIKSAPWFVVSVVIHLLVALILMNVKWMDLNSSENMILEASYEHDEIEPLPEEDLEEEEEEELEEIEEVIEDPVVTEDEVTEEIFEEDQAPIDAPFEGKSMNDVIGIGGGAGGRFGGKYRRRAARKGGGRATQKAVEWGLEWLKRHQDPEGFWDCDGFDMQCTDTRCPGKGESLNDVGVTGLALLAFLGAGNTVSAGPYKKVVKKGVKYLCDVQDPEDGCLVPKEGTHWMYNHALATLALTEAYGLSKWPILKKHAQRALDFVHKSKNPGRAWRYANGEIDPVEQNDVSVTGWMIMCIASAKDFKLRYDKKDMEDALLYLDEMTDTATGRSGYKTKGSFSSREAGDEAIWPFEESEAMTAVAMLGRVFAGNVLGDMDSQEPALDAGAALLRKKLPEWNEEKGCIDFYYWYYASYAMYQMAGKDWSVWKTAMEKTIVGNQVKEGCGRGSWDPKKDPWGNNGGRVYSTALLTLCLEVFYRYDNVLGSR
jgi:hypothetical protein